MKNGISRRRLVAALPVAMASLAVFSLSGCSDRGGDSKGQSAPLDLTGSWVQAQDNRSSDDSWQEAVIEDGEITINWMSSDGTSALYWVGSYEPPTEDVDEYTWESVGDTESMSTALLASGDESKTFVYSDGRLSYEASMLGVTVTVELERT